MPSSTVRAFTDPDEYFAGIRNLQIEGVVLQRGEFRATSTHINLHRLFIYRSDVSLPRIMKVTPSGTRAGIVFATDPGQPLILINGIEIADGHISRTGLDWEWYLRSSAPSAWGSMSLTPEDLAAAGEAIIGRSLVPATFARSMKSPAPVLSRLREAARSGGSSRENRSGHPREAGGRASDRTGFGGSDGFLPDGAAFPRCAQCPAPSCKSNDASRSGGHCVTVAWNIWA